MTLRPWRAGLVNEVCSCFSCIVVALGEATVTVVGLRASLAVVTIGEPCNT